MRNKLWTVPYNEVFFLLFIVFDNIIRNIDENVSVRGFQLEFQSTVFEINETVCFVTIDSISEDSIAVGIRFRLSV